MSNVKNEERAIELLTIRKLLSYLNLEFKVNFTDYEKKEYSASVLTVDGEFIDGVQNYNLSDRFRLIGYKREQNFSDGAKLNIDRDLVAIVKGDNNLNIKYNDNGVLSLTFKDDNGSDQYFYCYMSSKNGRIMFGPNRMEYYINGNVLTTISYIDNNVVYTDEIDSKSKIADFFDNLNMLIREYILNNRFEDDTLIKYFYNGYENMTNIIINKLEIGMTKSFK